MKKRENTFLKLDWPFKGLGKVAKKAAAGIVDFFKDEELQEISESIERSMNQINESLERIKKSTRKRREQNGTITAYKCAEQSLENASNELDCKARDLDVIVTKNRYSSYLRNSIWQNRQN